MTEHSRQRRLSILGVCVVATLLLLVAGRWWLRGPHPATPLLYIAPQQLELGHVLAKPDHIHSLTLFNRSSTRVEIDDFVTSCGCVKVSPQHVALEPSDSIAIQLQLDLMKYLKTSDDLTVPAAIRIAPVINGATGSDWVAKVEVVRPKVYSLFPEVDFGTVSQATTAIESVETVYVADEITDTALSTPFPFAADAKLTLATDTVPNYSAHHLSISLGAEPRPFGEFAFIVSLKSGHNLPQLEVPCRIRFDSGLRIETGTPPQRVVPVGQTVSWTVLVYRVGGGLTKCDLRPASTNKDCRVTITPTAETYNEMPVWCYLCECLPENAGDICVQLDTTAELADGKAINESIEVQFYALTETQTEEG